MKRLSKETGSGAASPVKARRSWMLIILPRSGMIARLVSALQRLLAPAVVELLGPRRHLAKPIQGPKLPELVRFDCEVLSCSQRLRHAGSSPPKLVSLLT